MAKKSGEHIDFSKSQGGVHVFPIRVYYEDTDMAGIVYHANYLKYIERARSDWVREMGVDQNAMRDEDGIVFAVRRVECRLPDGGAV